MSLYVIGVRALVCVIADVTRKQRLAFSPWLARKTGVEKAHASPRSAPHVFGRARHPGVPVPLIQLQLGHASSLHCTPRWPICVTSHLRRWSSGLHAAPAHRSGSVVPTPSGGRVTALET
ncbi:MAG TPA: hypothetical protein VKB35_16235 [Ktedonobacteraceae bacterium]|nr:hypothetical protein [Ktedonobacteraceae bacterium]